MKGKRITLMIKQTEYMGKKTDEYHKQSDSFRPRQSWVGTCQDRRKSLAF